MGRAVVARGGGATSYALWTLLRAFGRHVENRVEAERKGRCEEGCRGGQAAGEGEGEQGGRDVRVLFPAVLLPGQRYA